MLLVSIYPSQDGTVKGIVYLITLFFDIIKRIGLEGTAFVPSALYGSRPESNDNPSGCLCK